MSTRAIAKAVQRRIDDAEDCLRACEVALRDAEWGDAYGCFQRCPACHARAADGHTSTCTLAVARGILLRHFRAYPVLRKRT